MDVTISWFRWEGAHLDDDAMYQPILVEGRYCSSEIRARDVVGSRCSVLIISAAENAFPICCT